MSGRVLIASYTVGTVALSGRYQGVAAVALVHSQWAAGLMSWYAVEHERIALFAAHSELFCEGYVGGGCEA